MRSNTIKVKVGNVVIGGSNKVVIQSMTNTKTKDIEKTVKQINDLTLLGCEIVRVAVLDEEDALAIKEIKKQIRIPIVVDIHFDYKLAILAITSGADKIRINPGNIGSNDKVKQIVDKCKEYHVPIRIGINSGSLEKDLLEKYHHVTPLALLESMDRAVKLMESFDFKDLVLSIKATDIESTIEVNRTLAAHYPYPIHIGLTESGTKFSGTIASSYVLGTLLFEGIGNTIRVSLHGSPLNEIPVCKEILSMCHLYQKPRLIVCPTCGRTNYNMEPVVKEIESFCESINKDLTIAIMGCVVNGPGEAREADLGIAGGNGCGVLFKKGEIIKKIPEDKIVDCLKEEILKMINTK